jgi:hypothetical protein
MGKLFGLAAAATLCLVLSSAGLTVAKEEHPAFGTCHKPVLNADEKQTCLGAEE